MTVGPINKHFVAKNISLIIPSLFHAYCIVQCPKKLYKQIKCQWPIYVYCCLADFEATSQMIRENLEKLRFSIVACHILSFSGKVTSSATDFIKSRHCYSQPHGVGEHKHIEWSNAQIVSIAA